MSTDKRISRPPHNACRGWDFVDANNRGCNCGCKEFMRQTHMSSKCTICEGSHHYTNCTLERDNHVCTVCGVKGHMETRHPETL
jgi:hypothetical protein